MSCLGLLRKRLAISFSSSLLNNSIVLPQSRSLFSARKFSTPNTASQPQGSEAEFPSPDPEEAEISIEAKFEELQKEHKKTVEQIGEVRDKLLRALADSQNERQRYLREIENQKQFAVTNFAKGMLEVADNISMALKSFDKSEISESGSLKQLYEGVVMTDSVLVAVFDRFNIVKYDPIGEPFDPNLHEAVFEMDDPSQKKGSVAQVIQTGYKIKDRVLRAAKVGVTKS